MREWKGWWGCEVQERQMRSYMRNRTHGGDGVYDRQEGVTGIPYGNRIGWRECYKRERGVQEGRGYMKDMKQVRDGDKRLKKR